MKDETVHLLLKRTPMCTELPIHNTKGNRPGACIAIARAQQGAGMVGVVRAAGAAGTAGTAGTTGTAGEADAAGALCVDLEGNIIFFQDSEVKAGT